MPSGPLTARCLIRPFCASTLIVASGGMFRAGRREREELEPAVARRALLGRTGRVGLVAALPRDEQVRARAEAHDDRDGNRDECRTTDDLQDGAPCHGATRGIVTERKIVMESAVCTQTWRSGRVGPVEPVLPAGGRIGETPGVDLYFSAEDENFRAEARDWLTHALEGEFAGVRGRGGPGDEHALFEERLAWERALGAAGWTCLSWPAEYGGRDVTLLQQVIFYEEYARAGGPGSGRASSARGSSARRSCTSGRTSRSAGSCPRSRAARSSGARATRSRTRLGPGEHRDARRARGRPVRRGVGGHRPEGVDVARALGRLVLRARAHRPRRPVIAASRTSSCRWTSPASRSGRSSRSPATRVQRGVLRRCAHPGRPRRR